MLTFTCPKCGLDNQSAIPTRYEPDTDRLHCTCGRCRFEWYESPADQRSTSLRSKSDFLEAILNESRVFPKPFDRSHHTVPIPGPIAELDVEQSEKLLEWLGIPVCAECGTRHP